MKNVNRVKPILFLISGMVVMFSLFIFFISSIANSSSSKDHLLQKAMLDLKSDRAYNYGYSNKEREVIEVISETMDFQLSKRELSSGWTTFRYKNLSEETHFFVLQKLPEGKTLMDTKKEVMPVFEEAMSYINNGMQDQGYAHFENLPKWFYEVQFVGGPGLISPKKNAEVTVKLEPGHYVMECYVKMANGMFHSIYGMIEEFDVLNKSNGYNEPKGSIKVTISGENGIQFPNNIMPGQQKVAVLFKDQKVYENFVGHDVHLIRLNEGANLEELNKWMNWADPEAFKTPAPKGVEFLGGTQEMPAGNTAYFNVLFKPGKYAFIAEVPDPKSKNMLQTFTVRSGSN